MGRKAVAAAVPLLTAAVAVAVAAVAAERLRRPLAAVVAADAEVNHGSLEGQQEVIPPLWECTFAVLWKRSASLTCRRILPLVGRIELSSSGA